MKLPSFKVSLSLLIALSASLCLTSCATTEQQQLGAALSTSAQSSVVDQALQASTLPQQPSQYRQIERSGVLATDRLDIAVTKYDAALGRANGKIEALNRWIDRNRAAQSNQKISPP